MSDSKCELMVSWLHQQQMEKIWSDSDAIDEGVVLKKSKGDYACCPESLHHEPEGFRKAVELLNVRVGFLLGIFALIFTAVLIINSPLSPLALV